MFSVPRLIFIQYIILNHNIQEKFIHYTRAEAQAGIPEPPGLKAGFSAMLHFGKDNVKSN